MLGRPHTWFSLSLPDAAGCRPGSAHVGSIPPWGPKTATSQAGRRGSPCTGELQAPEAGCCGSGPSPGALLLVHNGPPGGLGRPGQGCSGERHASRWPTWPGVSRLSSWRKGPSRGGQAAPGARRGGRLGCSEPCALPASLPPSLPPPLAAARLHFKERPREGVPGEVCSPVAARRRGRLYSCQADREELTLPTRLLPRPPPAGLAHTLTRSAPLERGQAGPAAC